MKPYSLMFLLILVYCSLIWIDPASARRQKLFKNPFWSSRKDNLPLHQSEIQLVREWNRYPEIPPPRTHRWMPPRHPAPKKHPSREPYPMADIVSELFPGLSFTRQPPVHKEKEQHFNEIHVEIGNVDDLTNILGYDDIVLSIKDQKSESVLPRPDTERPSKPFWGPPIESLTTRTPKPFPFHLPSTTAPNIWHQTTSAGSKNPSEVGNNEVVNKRPTAPTESFSWRPDDFVTPLVQLTNNDPFDGFWNLPTSESSLSNSPTSESPISKPSENNHDPFDQQSDTVIQQSRDIESGQQGAGIMATHPHPHTRQDYHPHNGYHPPAPSYHPPPSLMKVDFSPLFLALIPLALVLGAAASFALSSAVTSNTAVASAQQQQQQQEASNNNNNANSNSNTNTILSLLAALNNNQDNQPYFVIVNGTSVATGREIRRRWEHKLMDLMSN